MLVNNPIKLPGNEPIRDPMILPFDGRYYMTGTCAPFWEGANPGVKLWVSDDLVHWSFVRLLIDASEIPEDKPYRDRFWAPELHHIRGRFYLTFNAHNAKLASLGESLSSWVAVADNIEGPYEICDTPLLPGRVTNDANLFEDDDGQVYVFLTDQPRIVMLRFDPDTCRTFGEPSTVIEAGKNDEWDSAGIEGSFVLKRGGKYYHWYSSWTRAYEMGLAVTESLGKPFEKCDINPVISGFERETVMRCCGHNSCFTMPDGREMVAFHANGDGFAESLCINEVKYPFERSMIPSDTAEL